MTTTEVAVPSDTRPAPRPDWLSQATAVEQSRAVAEVQAAIVVAQQCPRDVQSAVASMRESCRQKGLAERAFYRFPRGRETVTGESVHLARELARCWGNIQYGIVELRRDDEGGYSEMRAFAWDVQTNTRSEQIFVVPHKKDTRQGVKDLVDLRDIYENNANNGSRRVRQCIFSLVPAWFVEEAKTLCLQTLSDGGGKTMAQQVADAVNAFEQIGVTVGQIERKLGRRSGQWTAHDLAQLRITHQSLSRGEITVDDEFPAERVTAAELASPVTDADIAAMNAEAGQ